jgi:hypothetical protein
MLLSPSAPTDEAVEKMASASKNRKLSIGGAGFGMVSLVISLGVVAVGGAVSATVLLGGSSGSSGSLLSGNGSPANRAYDVAAESTLSTAQSAVQTAAIATGYTAISAQTLEGDEPSVQFTSGPSTSNSQVSVASSGAQQPGGSLGSIPAVGGTSPGGSVTLATYSNSTSGQGSCLFVWMTQGATWYGAEPGESSCQAAALTSAPQQSSPTSGSIGWAQGTFPNP